jgi:hypothetical protein
MHTSCSSARKHLLSVVGVSLLLSAAGCGGSSGAVSGKVYYYGKPLPGGEVIFVHEKGSFSTGIGEDGGYRLDKVPVGPVKIAVISHAASPGTFMSPRVGSKVKQAVSETKGGEKASKEIMARMIESTQGNKPAIYIPSKYNDAGKSGLEYTVVSGSQPHDIQLK